MCLFQITPWGSIFFLNSRLWAGVFFEVTLGGSGVCSFEITPRRDVNKEDTRTPRRDFTAQKREFHKA